MGRTPEPGSDGAGAAIERLVLVIAQLREHCPWMGALTHASLVEYLIEECYELVDAIEALEALEALEAAGTHAGPAAGPASTDERGSAPGTPRAGGAVGARDELRGELGDVLLQVVLHAQLQREHGGFGMLEVIEGLTRKMERRNPHVFRPDGSLQERFPATVEEIVDTWQVVKKQESPSREPFDGIPRHLPALALAAKSLGRAASLHPAAPPPRTDVPAAPPLPAPATEEQLGEQLFALARAGVEQGLDPERALRAAVARFQAAAGGAAGGS